MGREIRKIKNQVKKYFFLLKRFEKITWSLFSFLLALFVSSCKDNSKERIQDPVLINEQLTQMNRRHVGEESKIIEEFITRHGYKMKSTGTGLRYEIYQQGKGENPVMHSEVEINYKIFLLDGSQCYSSDSTGSVKMAIGTNEQLRGLIEALMLMVPGDKARMVLPAHLGFGTSGDGDKIPPASTLFLDVELINVKK